MSAVNPIWNKDGWGVFQIASDRFVVRQWPMLEYTKFENAKAEAERLAALENAATFKVERGTD